MRKMKVRIYSIYGQIEAAVADAMVEAPGSEVKVIAFESIPAEYQYNKQGLKAHCALVMTKAEARNFDERVAALRA